MPTDREAEDALDVLAGKVYPRLRRADKRTADAVATETLRSRHSREYADLREAAARRIAEARERQGLW